MNDANPYRVPEMFGHQPAQQAIGLSDADGEKLVLVASKLVRRLLRNRPRLCETICADLPDVFGGPIGELLAPALAGPLASTLLIAASWAITASEPETPAGQVVEAVAIATEEKSSE